MQTEVGRSRWKGGLPAGLDNAVKQAEERGFDKLDIFDADCHQMEPFKTLVRYAPEPLRHLLIEPDPEEDPWQKTLYLHNKGTFKDVTVFLKDTEVIKRPEIVYPEYQEANELIGVFTQLMRDIGIKTSIVLPTLMLNIAFGKPEIEVAAASAYVDYMLENFLGKYPEILTLVDIPTNSPDKAVELIDRVGSEKGIAGIMISATATTIGGNDYWDPVYEVAQSKGLPISFHGTRTMEGPFRGLEFVGYHAISFPFSLVRHLTSIVLSGVPVRFPRLKFAFMEGGVSWLPWLVHRLDDEYTKRRVEAPLLEKLPSDYMKQFYYTSQPLEQSHIEDLEHIFKMMDFENNLMYASDYPHWDFDVPSVIYDLPFLTDTAKKKILSENARKFFKL